MTTHVMKRVCVRLAGSSGFACVVCCRRRRRRRDMCAIYVPSMLVCISVAVLESLVHNGTITSKSFPPVTSRTTRLASTRITHASHRIESHFVVILMGCGIMKTDTTKRIDLVETRARKYDDIFKLILCTNWVDSFDYRRKRRKQRCFLASNMPNDVNSHDHLCSLQ